MELPAGTKRTFDRGHEWLTSGPEKMIVAHCFTGYLRSIVFAACFLSWQGPGFFFVLLAGFNLTEKPLGSFVPKSYSSLSSASMLGQKVDP